jgi:prevent-host-death family protein
MKFATVRQLKNETSAMLRLAARGKDVLVTSRGRPVAVLHGLNEEEMEDYVLSRHPGLRASIEDAAREYKAGGGISLSEFVRRQRAPVRAGRRRAALHR